MALLPGVLKTQVVTESGRSTFSLVCTIRLHKPLSSASPSILNVTEMCKFVDVCWTEGNGLNTYFCVKLFRANCETRVHPK